jgi:hypothetical protein
LLGKGRGLADLHDSPIEGLDQHLPLEFMEWVPVGHDLRVRALTPQGRAAFAAPKS